MEPGVEPVPDVPGFVHEPVAGRPIGEVGHQHRRAAAPLPHLGGDAFGRLSRASAMNDDVRPRVGQRQGHRPANTRRRAQDRGPASSQLGTWIDCWTSLQIAFVRSDRAGPTSGWWRKFVLIHVIPAISTDTSRVRTMGNVNALRRIRQVLVFLQTGWSIMGITLIVLILTELGFRGSFGDSEID